MKICIVSDGLPFDHGGAQLRAYRHAQNLNALQPDSAFLIVLNRSRGPEGDPDLPAWVKQIHLRTQPLKGKSRLVTVIGLAFHIGEIVLKQWRILFGARRQFDILHIINAATLFSLLSISTAHALGKKVIVEMVLVGADDPAKLNLREHDSRRPIKYRLFLQADGYVSKSDALSAIYGEAGLTLAKLRQISSGVDEKRFSPAPADQKLALRKKLGLKEDGVWIIFVGLICERKGPDRVLAAFGRLAQKYPDLCLLILGPNPEEETAYLEKMRLDLKGMGIEGRVILNIGRYNNVEEYLRASDIFVLPTQREGLSVAILEAMACGLPVAVSNIPEISISQVRDGVEGLLFDPDDIEQISGALGQLAQDAALRDRLGAASRQKVLKEFTQTIIQEQYLQFYQELLEDHD